MPHSEWAILSIAGDSTAVINTEYFSLSVATIKQPMALVQCGQHDLMQYGAVERRHTGNCPLKAGDAASLTGFRRRLTR
jgi:hypothetical protein